MKLLISTFCEAIGPNGLNAPLNPDLQAKYMKTIFAWRTFKTGIEIMWGTKCLCLVRSARSQKWVFQGHRSTVYDFREHTWTGLFILIALKP